MDSVGSPDEDRKPVVEVFDLPESSSEDVSPDMESHAMFIKLKEVGTSVQTGNQLNNSQFTILYRDKEKEIPYQVKHPHCCSQEGQTPLLLVSCPHLENLHCSHYWKELT
jgi:hypothetical protein